MTERSARCYAFPGNAGNGQASNDFFLGNAGNGQAGKGSGHLGGTLLCWVHHKAEAQVKRPLEEGCTTADSGVLSALPSWMGFTFGDFTMSKELSITDMPRGFV